MPIVLPFSAPMVDKRGALASEIASVLAVHESGWIVSQRYVLDTERPGGSKAMRDNIMGSPVKYCRVANVGRTTDLTTGTDTATGSYDVAGSVRQVGHVFAVYLWRQFEDNESNRDLWDAITEGQSPNGVLVHLAGLGALDVGGCPTYVHRPQEVIIPDEPLHMGDEDYVRYAQFFLTLT